MVYLLVQWILSALALLVVARFMPGFQGTSFPAALIAATILGLLNAALGILFKLIPFPFSILSLGILLLVVNGLIVEALAQLVAGFEVHGMFPVVGCGIVLGLLGMVVRAVSERA